MPQGPVVAEGQHAVGIARETGLPGVFLDLALDAMELVGMTLGSLHAMCTSSIPLGVGDTKGGMAGGAGDTEEHFKPI